jgi:serine/threonine protein kinase
MSDKASSIRTADLPPLPRETGQLDSHVPAGSHPLPLAQDNDPTVISNRPPALPAEVSESARRILAGRICPGDRLGHFELLQYVGGGGMGRVFKAQDGRLARTVALKILPPDQAADHETLLRFQNEAQSAARLDHDNIVRVYYVGEDNGLHYIVFEFIEGINIRELVETKGPLPLAEAISYTLQAADALAHAAKRKIVHRDVKPSNLLITPEGQVKLIDMGLARLREADNPGGDLTASGVTLGTFDYISPEQARDPRSADVRSDVYSLGCTFFYMLTGRPPFPGGTVLQKLLQHQGDQPPDVRQFRSDLPEGVTRVLRRMLAKDPRHRYRDPADLMDDLLLAAKEVGLQPLRPGRRVWAAPREPTLSLFQRHLPWILPLAALIAIVIALDFYWSRAPSPDALVPPLDPPGGGFGVPPEVDRPGHGDVTTKSPPGAPAGKHAPSAVSPGPASRVAAAPTAKTVAAKPEEPSKPSAKRAGVLVVGAPVEGESNFATLGAACQAASDGDVIELRYDGPREEQPITLANLRLTVRAADGFQPVVLFRPAAEPAVTGPERAAENADRPKAGGASLPVLAAPFVAPVLAGVQDVADGSVPPTKAGATSRIASSRSMLSVTSGRLTLINVALELDLPRVATSESWSLFCVLGNPSLRLEKCWLTVRNAYNPLRASQADAAFFRVKALPADTATSDRASPPEPAALELADCVARGEAVALRSEDLQPVRFTWDNGLLVTTERLLSAFGGAGPQVHGETLRISLRHLTAVVQSGLCRLATGPGTRHQFLAQINCADTILVGSPGSSLIEQVADRGPDDLRQQIAWSGDRNIYDGFDVFWAIRRLDPEAPPDLMAYEAWKLHWGSQRENLPRSEKVDWKLLPEAGVPLDRHAPADYSLNMVDDANPAVGTSSDGHNLGCQLDRLSAVPPESPPAKAIVDTPKPEEPPAGKTFLEELELDKPAPDEPTPGEPTPDKPAPGKPAPGKPAPGKPAPGKPGLLKPVPDKSVPDGPDPGMLPREKPLPSRPAGAATGLPRPPGELQSPGTGPFFGLRRSDTPGTAGRKHGPVPFCFDFAVLLPRPPRAVVGEVR